MDISVKRSLGRVEMCMQCLKVRLNYEYLYGTGHGTGRLEKLLKDVVRFLVLVIEMINALVKMCLCTTQYSL